VPTKYLVSSRGVVRMCVATHMRRRKDGKSHITGGWCGCALSDVVARWCRRCRDRAAGGSVDIGHFEESGTKLFQLVNNGVSEKSEKPDSLTMDQKADSQCEQCKPMVECPRGFVTSCRGHATLLAYFQSRAGHRRHASKRRQKSCK
jgi:hypothetical protein